MGVYLSVSQKDKKMYIRILENDDWIVDYDAENNQYRVSYFQDNHFVDEVWFDAYEWMPFSEPYVSDTNVGNIKKALEVLGFEKSLANTETAEAIDTAIHCINIVSAIENPKLAEVLSTEDCDEFHRRKLEMKEIMTKATPQQRKQIIRYFMSD